MLAERFLVTQLTREPGLASHPARPGIPQQAGPVMVLTQPRQPAQAVPPYSSIIATDIPACPAALINLGQLAAPDGSDCVSRKHCGVFP